MPPFIWLEFNFEGGSIMTNKEIGEMFEHQNIIRDYVYPYDGCTSYGCQSFDIRKTFHLLWQGSRINNIAQRYENGSEYAEVLISNYDTSERMRDMPSQLNLFDTELLFNPEL